MKSLPKLTLHPLHSSTNQVVITGIGTPTKQGRILPSGKSYPGFVDKKVKKNQVLPSLLRKSRQKKLG